MKITFLGTGTSTGIPIIGSKHPVCLSENYKDKRLRSSIMIEWDVFKYVVDTGPDFRQQMLNSNCDRLNGVLYTHEHADHTAGIDDIRPFCYNNGEIPIYAHQRVLSNLSIRFSYIFKTKNRYPGSPSVNPVAILENRPFTLSNLEIVPISYLHGDLQVFGYRFNDFAYLTDLKTINDFEISKLKNLDVLVLNAIRIEPHFSHLNLEEALNLIKKIKPKKTYLTHISHKLGFHNEVEAKLPNNVYLSYDGLELSLS
ncbi:MAG: MBL fold metallo-hydrolase [Bacteroidetes bacterium]|nr:MBL fold metallo-hydrolase [Bacteroidota bacterium]MDA1019240.1 MBL fold metallo-hydrolase [Bacteroidota bacterium]